MKFLYNPYALVPFDEYEVDKLMLLSLQHYDGKCRQAGQPDGILWGIKNAVHAGITERPLDAHEVNLLGKIAERDLILLDKFTDILRALNDEYERLNPKQHPDRGATARPKKFQRGV